MRNKEIFDMRAQINEKTVRERKKERTKEKRIGM